MVLELAGAFFEDFPWFWSLLVLLLRIFLGFGGLLMLFFGGLELAYAFFLGVWSLLMLFFGGLGFAYAFFGGLLMLFLEACLCFF